MKSIPRIPLALVAAALLIPSLASAQTTVFHYRVNDTDAAGLPTVPSVGGANGTAQGTFTGLLSADIPTAGVPAGAGNRSLVGANDPGSGGVNSAATQELLNSTIILNGGFTYECWFKWNGGGNVNAIIDYAGTEKFRIHTGIAGNLDMNFDGGNGGSGDGGSGAEVLEAAPTSGEWHYVAIVFEHDGNPEMNETVSGTMTWYYDGTDAAAGTAAVTKSDFGDGLNRVIGVGHHPQGFGGDNFDGLIYEPRVTLGALTPEQLLFRSGPASDPQLVAPTTESGNSDGNPIQFTIPINNAAGTTQDLILTAPGITSKGAFALNSFTTPVTADGGTGSIVVDFTPITGDGFYEATLTINSNDPLNPAAEVALTVEVRDPAIVIDASLDFGIFSAVPAPIADNVLVDNLGGATALTLTNLQITGAGAAAYAVTSLPVSVAPLDSDVIEITFNPGVGGDFPAVLTMDTNDPRNPQVTVPLSAQVFDPEVQIDSVLDFGLLPNTPGVVGSFINVDNFATGSGLVLSNPQLTGPAAANFSLQTTFPLTVDPSLTEVIDVDFDPGTSGGSFIALLVLDTNDPFMPQVAVPLIAGVEGAIDLDGPSKVSHWTFDDAGNLGDDTGGLDYDGIVNGDAAASNLAAVGSGALLLDGDADYIEIPTGALRYELLDDDGDGLTVAAWVCSNSAPSDWPRQRYFSKFGADPFGFGVGQDGDTQLFATTYGVFDYAAGAGSLPVQDEWHHVAYVFFGSPPSSVDYYVDGAFVTTITGNSGLNDSIAPSFAIGGLGSLASEWFDGLLDDLRVYAVELAEPDIAALAALGTPGAKPGGGITITSVGLSGPSRLRIEFNGRADTLHEVMSSSDLLVTPFTGAVTPAIDGLTTNGNGDGFVEIDITIPGTLFFQVQEP